MDLSALPFACLITGQEMQNKPWFTRLVEVAIAGCLGGAFSLGVFFTKLDNRIDAVAASVKTVQTNLDAHDQRNKAYREEHSAKEAAEDAKWDSRIQRLENCFILGNCMRSRR